MSNDWILFFIGAIGMMLVGGFHSYGGGRGYHYMSRAQAWNRSWKTMFMLTIVAILFGFFKYIGK